MSVILKALFLLIALVCMVLLQTLNVNFILTLVITFIVLMVCNYIVGGIERSIHVKALDTDCDPERYLRMMDKKTKRFRKNDRIKNYLAINQAAGYMLLGKMETALEILENIDTSYLSEKNSTYLAYTINLILCYYALGEIEKAELLYQTDLVKLSPVLKRHKKAVEILVGERYYYLKEYDKSYQYLKELLDFDLSKRQYLGILYILAQIEVIKGEHQKAEKKYRKIVKLGNKLWIAKEAQKYLSSLEGNTTIHDCKDGM